MRGVFAALARHKNVLLTGPPGTGKTRLLTETAHWFESVPPAVLFDPVGEVPFPPGSHPEWLPSPDQQHRKSFRITFHPATRYRHLLRGLEPVPDAPGEFRYSFGALFRANEHAKKESSTALLVIDELNRGPAVEVFGDAVVALEADKRLDDAHNVTTDSFPILLPDAEHEMADYYFSPHLYVLAAMNEADASVAPVDVAFRRRWKQIALQPDASVVRSMLGLHNTEAQGSVHLELLEAFVKAWEEVNRRIGVLRGNEYRIGHSVAIPQAEDKIDEESGALTFVAERWRRVEDHVGEVFFGDPRAEVAVLAGSSAGTYQLVEETIGTEQGQSISRPNNASTSAEWIQLLSAVADAS